MQSVAELVRMIHTIVGPKDFRAGADLYFDRHDGQAVTCEDFVRAMESASGADLSQFRLWYSQAGTPKVTARLDRQGPSLRLLLDQEVPATPGQARLRRCRSSPRLSRAARPSTR